MFTPIDAFKSILFNHRDSNNLFEAFSVGATVAVGPVGAIVANLIAFTAIFQFIDTIVAWIFSQVTLQNFGLSVKDLNFN